MFTHIVPFKIVQQKSIRANGFLSNYVTHLLSFFQTVKLEQHAGVENTQAVKGIKVHPRVNVYGEYLVQYTVYWTTYWNSASGSTEVRTGSGNNKRAVNN